MNQGGELPSATGFAEDGEGENIFGSPDNQVIECRREENTRQFRLDFADTADRLDTVQTRHVHVQQH